MRTVVAALGVVALLATMAGCGSAAGGETGATGSARPAGTIRVFAASSLTGAFTRLARQFEHRHPGTTVELNFAASSDLAEQITNGAPADVFASASPTNMDQVVEVGDATRPRTFAVNTMEIAVPPGNPGGVHRLADLARPATKVAVCQPQVPCGAVAAEVFHHAGITVHPVTEEVDVKSVLTKVAVGEVDAGVVYVTDVRAATGQVRGVRISAAVNASTRYPIAVVRNSPHAATARAFEQLVLSAQGRRVLATAGFGQP
ncbi:MAG TPA: molybdate ABC transporter substrate-binding protein [Marmoricola sp.]|nr:molybdate ABC transporter substrate-binding protein [Marmoricola sp.]